MWRRLLVFALLLSVACQRVFPFESKIITQDANQSEFDLRPIDLKAMLDGPQPDFFVDVLDGGSPASCPASVLFCETFEQDLKQWSDNNTQEGSVDLDTSIHYRGKQSAHAHLEVGTIVQAVLVETKVIPKPEFWLRAYFYLPSQLNNSVINIISLQQDGKPDLGDQVWLQNGFLYLQPDGSGGVLLDNWSFDQWVCVVFKVTLASAANGGQIELNLLDESGLKRNYKTGPVDSEFSPPVKKLKIGLYAEAASQPLDLWFDEVLINDKPLDCTQ